MTVDVTTEIVIARPRSEVAAFAVDPDQVTDWYANIERVEWKTPRPLDIGSALTFVARFMGRTLTYTYAVVEYTPGVRFVMRTAEGPFPMETSYEWSDAGAGHTRMTLRNHGEPSGFSKLAAPFMVPAMRRANRKDLDRLKQLLEAG